VPVPKSDFRTSKLIDGVVWDGKDPKKYAASFKIGLTAGGGPPPPALQHLEIKMTPDPLPGLMAVRPWTPTLTAPVRDRHGCRPPPGAPAAVAASLGERFGNFMRAVLPPLIGLALVVGLWALVAMKSSDFPGPAKTLDAAVVLFSDPSTATAPTTRASAGTSCRPSSGWPWALAWRRWWAFRWVSSSAASPS
jgi:hypothetical protein